MFRFFRPAFTSARHFSSVAAEPVLLVQKRGGDQTGIVDVILNNKSKANALSKALLDSLANTIRDLRSDRSARVVILRSSSEKAFCAGADLKERKQMTPEEGGEFVIKLRSTFTEFSKLPQVTIAMMDGPAFGGGLELALACDLRVAGANAKMGLVETSLAIIPGAGGTQRLPRLIGAGKAKELIFTSRKITAKEAEAIGLVNQAVDEVSSERAALKLAMEILPNGPIALAAAKNAISQGIEVTIEAGMNIEELNYAKVLPTKDRIEGMVSFAEKRKPKYHGH